MRMRLSSRATIFSVLFLAILCVAHFAEARFRQPSGDYKARRDKLMSGVDGPVVIFGYTGHEDASEVAVFFQEPYFYYLTGHDEPGAAVVIYPAPPQTGTIGRLSLEATLYVPPRDPAQEKWEGPKIGP